jgi:protein CpxP
MNRVQSTAAASLLLLTLAAVAPPASPAALAPAQNEQTGAPTPDQQLSVLTTKLDLTADQQAKIRPIFAQLDDLQAKLMADSTLTQEERLEKIRPARYKAANQIRAVLTDEQKPKFEAYLAGPHPEMHGNLNGSSAPQ